MSLLRKLGKAHVEILLQWVGSASAYGATGTLALFYFTDWKAVVAYIPFYNGKFQSDE